MANQSNGWTRERPKAVDCIRDFFWKGRPAGARERQWYSHNGYALGDNDGGNESSFFTDSWWHPVRADGRYPPLPSDETPAPLTPAEETTLRAPTAPEPSRLEIAARIMAGFASHPDAPACKSTTPEGIEAERNEYARGIATGCMRWADALIAAARNGGGA